MLLKWISQVNGQEAAIAAEWGRARPASPPLHHLLELQPHQVAPAQGLGTRHQSHQLLISHLLQKSQETSFEKHLQEKGEPCFWSSAGVQLKPLPRACFSSVPTWTRVGAGSSSASKDPVLSGSGLLGSAPCWAVRWPGLQEADTGQNPVSCHEAQLHVDSGRFQVHHHTVRVLLCSPGKASSVLRLPSSATCWGAPVGSCAAGRAWALGLCPHCPSDLHHCPCLSEAVIS